MLSSENCLLISIMTRKFYLVGISGEAEHQPAIERCVIGERVYIPLEFQLAGNSGELAVVSVRQEILGYIPRNGWFGRLIQKKGQSFDAIIMAIKSPSPGMPLGVALSVQVIKDPPRPREGNRESGASRLLGRMRRWPVDTWLN